ncbi:hypothetical protein [Soonwooa sp.]|uniref:hypothetical protein n=1 Tax=Soonwooa sp. TaxID=1938592 RepID=UPI0026350030|nr:hypothetical protein [Soonwooa sp.]
MMELNFSIFTNLLITIEKNPSTMLLIATIGVFFYMIFLGLVLWPFDNFIKAKNLSPKIKTYFYALGITLLFGSLTQILFYLLGVSGLHLAAIWLTLHTLSIFFSCFHFTKMDKIMSKLIQEKKAKLNMKTT